MRLKSIRCPECNAQIKLDEDTPILFCQYCGSQLQIDDEVKRSEHRNYNYYYNYDEARIREADVKMFNAENAERRARKEDRATSKAIIFIFALFVISFGILFILEHFDNEKQKHNEAQGLICPGNSGWYIGEDYQTVKAQFETMGFTNIQLISIGDKWFFSEDYGKVESVTINGKSFYKTDGFTGKEKVIISYH